MALESSYLWADWWTHGVVAERDKVESLEPRVASGVVDPSVAESLRRIPAAELADQRLRRLAHVPRPCQRLDALQNGVVRVHGIRAGKRRGPGDQLEHEAAKGPDVDRNVLALVEDDFGRDVFRGAAEGVRPRALRFQALRETEVGQLRHAIPVKEHVLGLEVSVDDKPPVQVVECFQRGGTVEPSSVLVEATPEALR